MFRFNCRMLLIMSILLILAFSVLAPSGNALNSGPKFSFHLKYHYSSELTYEALEIQNTKLFYTYLPPETVQKKGRSPVEQRPYWTQADLKTRVTVLSPGEFNDLKRLITQTNFMNLKGTYGGAKKEQRYYPTTLEVTMGNLERKVMYQSFPGASPSPTVFKKIQERLLGLVKRKFKV